ncbi:hypothetical protein [Fibrobacter succinogenes]|jgi:hypothetical protein|uniref:hypothetical protein n=1 Tax=Fibrobacter succinogenes TaxID=833 RepID=UPI0015681F8B|nr:hypothetical protein [Fibrobacter succinogenes]
MSGKKIYEIIRKKENHSELGPHPHDVLLSLKNEFLAVSQRFSKFDFDGKSK